MTWFPHQSNHNKWYQNESTPKYGKDSNMKNMSQAGVAIGLSIKMLPSVTIMVMNMILSFEKDINPQLREIITLHI